MDAVRTINYILAVVFFICYAYQAFYMLVPFIIKPKPHRAAAAHNFAVLISARNERAVIANLIDSVKRQTYTAGELRVFVCADNCTDDTARIAREHGAEVFERFNPEQVGKGYALNWLLERIDAAYPDARFDAYFVFDADNVLEPDYIEQMNRTYSDGYEIVTGYRNSKNFGDNWISSGYALWFMRESAWLNRSRMLLGTSCAVSGTGFMFSRRVLDECGGWNFFLLTEDIEFTIRNITAGRRIGYCAGAVLYDEQPTKLRQSLRQRKRWTKGYVQVFMKYGKRHAARHLLRLLRLLRHVHEHPARGRRHRPGRLREHRRLRVLRPDAAGRGGGVRLRASACSTACTSPSSPSARLTTLSEWKRIYAPAWKKITFTLTFPLFMLTYIPCTVAGLLSRDLSWKPIEHTRTANLSEIRAAARGARKTA